MKKTLIRTYYSFGLGSCKKRVWVMKSCIIMFLLLFLTQIVFQKSAISQGPNSIESQIRLNTIQLKTLEGYKTDIQSGKRLPIAGWYREYQDHLRDIMEIPRPDERYKKWAENRKLEVLNKVIELMDVAKRYKFSTRLETAAIQQFQMQLDSIRKEAEEAINSNNLDERLYLAYWRLAFIESYKDSKSKLEIMQPRVQEYIELANKRQKEEEEARQARAEKAETDRKEKKARAEREESERKEKEAAKWKEMEAKNKELQARAEAKKKATLAKYNVRAEVSADDLHKNPFQFEGKVILLTGASFDRMLQRGVAVCNSTSASMDWVGGLQYGRPVVSTSTQELLVSNVPVDFKGGWGLIVKCKGTTRATNALGAVITLPLVEYIAVFQQ